MKKRFIYSLLFGVLGFFVSLLIVFVIFGAVAGFLWLYVFGDDPWPSSTEKILPILFILAFFVLWTTFIMVGFVIGKNLEKDSELNKMHILISIFVIIIPIMLFILNQWRVGNIGSKPDSIICSDYCTEKGYSGSGMPAEISGEKSCSCFDSHGKEVIKIPMEDIVSGEIKN
jgi:hypothetical protein